MDTLATRSDIWRGDRVRCPRCGRWAVSLRILREHGAACRQCVAALRRPTP